MVGQYNRSYNSDAKDPYSPFESYESDNQGMVQRFEVTSAEFDAFKLSGATTWEKTVSVTLPTVSAGTKIYLLGSICGFDTGDLGTEAYGYCTTNMAIVDGLPYYNVSDTAKIENDKSPKKR